MGISRLPISMKTIHHPNPCQSCCLLPGAAHTLSFRSAFTMPSSSSSMPTQLPFCLSQYRPVFPPFAKLEVIPYVPVIARIRLKSSISFGCRQNVLCFQELRLDIKTTVSTCGVCGKRSTAANCSRVCVADNNLTSRARVEGLQDI